MEVWGGNGYVEEGPMARFYREAPVNSIWEGSGNVMCLDVLRAMEREAGCRASAVRHMAGGCARAPGASCGARKAGGHAQRAA